MLVTQEIDFRQMCKDPLVNDSLEELANNTEKAYWAILGRSRGRVKIWMLASTPLKVAKWSKTLKKHNFWG